VDNRRLALFCRPGSWRNLLESISGERGVAVNVVVEAGSLSIRTSIVSLVRRSY